MPQIKPKKLSDEEIKKTKKYSILDGSSYNVMYGFGEQYVTAYALKIGASSPEIGILSSVPAFLGSIFQIMGAKLTETYQDRKKIVLIFVFLQAMMYLPLFIIPLLTKNMLILTLIFSLYLIFANMAGPAWNSWIGDVVSENERAQYFSKRNKIAITVLFLSVLFAGIILNYFSDMNIWIGFGILFTIAFFGRLASWYFLSRQYEPGYVVKKDDIFSFKDFLKRVPETNFGNFVIFRSLMAFAIMIASPFFAVYMLRDLNFNYIQYTTIILTPMTIKVLTMTYWGEYADKFGTKKIMFISAFLIGLIPLEWLIFGYFYANTPYIFYLIILAESLSGFAWAGFELTTFDYMLETAKPGKRTRAFAYFNVLFGFAVLVGGLLGAYLTYEIPDISYHGIFIPAMLMIFFISAIMRCSVAIYFVNKMHEVRIDSPTSERQIFFDLIVAKPLNTALAHTTYSINMAEKDIDTIKNSAQDTLDMITKPIQPMI